jgi:hypothetical protein
MREAILLARLLETLAELGESLHHPLEDEARSALKTFAAVGNYDRQSRIAQAMLPGLERLCKRLAARSRPRRRA